MLRSPLLPAQMPWHVTTALIICAAIVLLPLYLAATAAAPMAFRNGPFPVMNDPVRTGTDIVLRVDRCVTAQSGFWHTITPTLVPEDGGVRQVLPGTRSFALPGCAEVDSHTITIPPSIPPGRYHLEGLVMIDAPFRQTPWQIPWRSEPFTVVAP